MVASNTSDLLPIVSGAWPPRLRRPITRSPWGLFIESLNEMIDVDTVRVAANRNRIPDSIWLMLAIVTVFSMMAVGYQFGLENTRNWAVNILMAMAFATVIMLIADIDRPQIGVVQVSQQPLLDLSARIQSAR